MQRKNVEQNKKKKRKTRKTVIRRRIFAGAVLAGSLILLGIGLAWYSRGERKAETEPKNVMEPYKLYLMNPSETDVLELSIGNLMLGETKQLVFCVSNGDETQYDIEYAMELIYTNNLDLNYTIYALEKTDEDNAVIVASDKVTVDGNEEEYVTYWKINGDNYALSGTDISDARHEEMGLDGDEVNCGTYILYENDANNSNNLNLTTGEDGSTSQYFLMEIKWNDSAQTNFERYDKETDMIYIVVRAVQPEPQK